MVKRSLLLVLTVSVLAGCGGGGGAAPSADSPKGAVQAFVGDVGRSDWKAACKLVDPMGQVDLVFILHVDYRAELDTFGQLKDCPASFQRHAAFLRAALKGADPGTTQQKGAAHAVVSSPKGNWAAVLVEKPAKQWRIAGVPRP